MPGKRYDVKYIPRLVSLGVGRGDKCAHSRTEAQIWSFIASYMTTGTYFIIKKRRNLLVYFSEFFVVVVIVIVCLFKA